MQFKQITSNDTRMLNEKGMRYFKTLNAVDKIKYFRIEY